METETRNFRWRVWDATTMRHHGPGIWRVGEVIEVEASDRDAARAEAARRLGVPVEDVLVRYCRTRVVTVTVEKREQVTAGGAGRPA
jgi:hypothetical protein